MNEAVFNILMQGAAATLIVMAILIPIMIKVTRDRRTHAHLSDQESHGDSALLGRDP